IKRLKGEKVEDTIDTSIELSVDGYIPLSYIEDEEQKIEVYKKIAAIKNIEDYRELIDELIDRFGDIPKKVENLLDISYIKNIASRINIKNISQSIHTFILLFNTLEAISPNLVHYIANEYGMMIGFDLSKNPSFTYTYRK